VVRRKKSAASKKKGTQESLGSREEALKKLKKIRAQIK